MFVFGKRMGRAGEQQYISGRDRRLQDFSYRVGINIIKIILLAQSPILLYFLPGRKCSYSLFDNFAATFATIFRL